MAEQKFALHSHVAYEVMPDLPMTVLEYDPATDRYRCAAAGHKSDWFPSSVLRQMSDREVYPYRYR